ncbi:MAG: hypothetical protein ACXAC8_02645 [Candidatus Hodarchaeales archaeon]|jgi:hypothetical protein
MSYKTVGWQSILVRIPVEWEMIFEKKKSKKSKKETGYFAFRDSQGKKFELSWAQIEKKAPKLTSVIHDYIDSLKKTERKIKIRSDKPREVKGHEAHYLIWELEKKKIQGYMVTWVCSHSERLIICSSQYTIQDQSKIKPIILEIYDQINCHPQSVFSIWSAPNLQIHAPYLKMKLKRSQFLIGLTFLNLKSEELEVFAYRIGLADQKATEFEKLTEWFLGYYQSFLPNIPMKYDPEKFTKILFKKKIEVWKNLHISQSKISLRKSSTHFETYLWMNPEKNDIYCLLFSIKGGYTSQIRESVEKMTKLAIATN